MNEFDNKIQFLNQLLDLDDDSWITLNIKDDIITQKKNISGSSFVAYRSYSIINGNNEQPKIGDMMNIIWNTYSNESNIKNYDSAISKYDVKNIDNNTRIAYQINKLPWPLWSRDVHYLQKRIISTFASYLLMYSIDNSDIKNKKCVRAIATISAYVFKPCGEKCIMYRIAHIEPGGIIPPFLTDQYIEKTTMMIKYFKQIYNS